MPGIGFVRRDEMKVLRIRSDRMTELRYVAAEGEVEWLDLLGVRLLSIKDGKWLDEVRAADGDPADGGAFLEA